jgi:hypothetical protein
MWCVSRLREAAGLEGCRTSGLPHERPSLNSTTKQPPLFKPTYAERWRVRLMASDDELG